MEQMLPADKAVGDGRYRETSGLYWEDFTPGDVFEHRPGRTILDTDNVWFTLLTMNVQPVQRAFVGVMKNLINDRIARRTVAEGWPSLAI